jgi:hypothetical protein
MVGRTHFSHRVFFRRFGELIALVIQDQKAGTRPLSLDGDRRGRVPGTQNHDLGSWWTRLCRSVTRPQRDRRDYSDVTDGMRNFWTLGRAT